MSNVFKILTLGTSPFFMGGFTLLGTIQVATNLGGKIIHAPQTISNFRTELQKTKKALQWKHTVKQTALSPNKIPSLWALTGVEIPTTPRTPFVNPNPKSKTGFSVIEEVNNKMQVMQRVLTSHMSAPLMGSPLMSELQFEEQISTIDQNIIESEQLLEQKKEDIEENHQELRVLGKSKEIRINIEEKYKDNPPVLGLPLDTNKISAYIIGTEREKGTIQISGEETIAELELRIRQMLGFSSKLDIILIYLENHLKIGEKFKNTPITENTKIVELIGENPSSNLVIYPQTQVAGGFSKEWQQVIDTKSLDKIFNNPQVSESTQQKLSVELEKLYQQVINELDSIILRGKGLGQFAYDNVLQKFENDLKSIVENDRSRTLLKEKFDDQVKSILSEKAINSLQSCLRGAILSLLIENSKTKNLQSSADVVPALLTYLEGNTIVGDLMKSALDDVFILETYAQLFNPSNKKGIITYESTVIEHIDSISRAEVSHNFIARILGSTYNQFQEENIKNFEIKDGNTFIFSLENDKKVILFNSLSNLNGIEATQEVTKNTIEQLAKIFQNELIVQDQQTEATTYEANINFLNNRHNEDGFTTFDNYFEDVLKNWKSAEISQFITDDFQGTLSKQDYLITAETITIEQLKNLGITKIFDIRGRELSLSGELRGSYRILTSEDGKSRALIEVTGKTVTTPEGWVDGIILEDDTKIPNALLTNKEGNLLSSSFCDPYNPLRFKLKNDNWLEIEFLQFLNEADKHYLYYDENGNPCGMKLLSVFSFTDGDSNLNFEMLVNLINPIFRTDLLKFEFSQIKPYFLDIQIKQQPNINNLDNILEVPIVNEKFLEEPSTKEKILDFYLFFEQFKLLVNNLDLEVRDLSVTTELRNLHNPDGTYDEIYFNDLLKNNFETISKYSWFTINRKNEVEHFNNLYFKEFCKTYLKFIQDNPELLDKYYWLFSLEFSGEKDFTNEDLALLQLLDDAMIDIFGYVNYILLQMGMLNFGKDNPGRFFKFGSHMDPEQYLKILRKTGISCLDGTKIDKKDLSSVIRSLITFGFKRTVEFTDGTTESYIIHPPNSIFADIFNGFNQYSTDSTYLNRINNLIDSIMLNLGYLDNKFFNSFLSDTKTLKKFLNLPIKLQLELKNLGGTLDQLKRITTEKYDNAIKYLQGKNNLLDSTQKRRLFRDYLRDTLFDTLLDYYLDYETKYKNHAEYIESINPHPSLSDLDNYPDDHRHSAMEGIRWKNDPNIQRLQRLFDGILTDFSNPLNGEQQKTITSNGIERIDYYNYLKSPLHHWMTAIRYSFQETGHENKYDCRDLSVWTIPAEGTYGHNRITGEISGDETGARGLFWENEFRKVIPFILDKRLPQRWSDELGIKNFNDYLKDKGNRDAIDLVLLFLSHQDKNYYNRIIKSEFESINT